MISMYEQQYYEAQEKVENCFRALRNENLSIIQVLMLRDERDYWHKIQLEADRKYYAEL